MRKFYQYNRKNEKPGAYGHDAAELVSNFVHWDESGYISNRRSIENQIDTISEVTGKLCDVLVSKGLMTHEEFLTILGLENSHESRDNSWSTSLLT